MEKGPPQRGLCREVHLHCCGLCGLERRPDGQDVCILYLRLPGTVLTLGRTAAPASALCQACLPQQRAQDRSKVCENPELWEESISGDSDHPDEKGQDTAAHNYSRCN